MKRLFILSFIAFLLISGKLPIQWAMYTDTSTTLNQAQAVQQDIWTQMRENTGVVPRYM